ncbi:MAG: hypothetical protein GX033_08160 [Firmicutes bacterium]|nr:hypothetical protein [Bacillota bacterium]
MRNRVRKMFLGGNTGYGFFSFYEQLISGENVRTYILKGGPGTGKSNFMRQIAQQMAARAYAVEEFYCSSDSFSLDGVQFPSLGVALVDGTAPHMLDPKHPGAIESVVELSTYWDEAPLKEKRQEIRKAVFRKGFFFRRAYGYLRLAKQIADEQMAYIQELGVLDRVGLNGVAVKLILELLPEGITTGRSVRERHLFACAITPQGMVNHLPSLVAGLHKRVWVSGPLGAVSSIIVDALRQAAQQRGYDVEVYHNPLDPKRVDHVIIPQLGIAVCNASEPYELALGNGDRIVNTADYLDFSQLEPFSEEFSHLQAAFQEAMSAAIGLIQRAKEEHAYLESLYTPHMDFERLEQRRARVLAEILELARAK